MGGGEEFMYQTMKWLHNIYSIYWLSFTDSVNKSYTHFEVINDKYGKMIHVENGLTFDNLNNWLKLLCPDVIHHQGVERKLVLSVCVNLNIPLITGFHFWSGGISLSSKSSNIKILDNIPFHKVDPELEYVAKHASHIYVASEFMNEVFSKVSGKVFDVIEPVPDEDSVVAESNKCEYKSATDLLCILKNLSRREYVTMVNIHKFKGGQLLLDYIIKCPDIKFMCIRTEPMSDNLDRKIKSMIEKSNGKYLERVSDMRPIYAQTKILLIPSIVDETYCRVATEGIMNCIPIMTTGAGNIKNIVRDAGIYDLSVNALRKLYFDNALYVNLCIRVNKRRLEIKTESNSQSKFASIIDKLTKIKSPTLMFYVPWTDQGLGIQAKHYVKVLESKGYMTSIFSYSPYSDIKQANPDEWKHQRIYYSQNNREDVTDDELIDFVRKYNVKVFIVPETCYFRVFQICTLMKALNIVCVCIPNIEIVRKSEVKLHDRFDYIWCNNQLCYDKLSVYDKKLRLIKFGIDNVSPTIMKSPRGKIRLQFLFLGGLNAFTRKNVIKVLEAFSITSQHDLVCCIQGDKNLDLIKPYMNRGNIKFNLTHLTCSDIDRLYSSCDCVVQVSSHEGLGLGFYESLAHGLPVVTLDTQPHNEVIENGKLGVTIKCNHIPLPDNDDGLVQAAVFDTQDLIDKLNDMDPIRINIMKSNCTLHNYENYNKFIERLDASASEALTTSLSR